MIKKYNYYIKLKKPFTFKNNLYFEKVFNLKEDVEYYYFYVFNYNHNILNDENIQIEIEELNKSIIKNFFSKYIITILGITIFIISLFAINRNITEVKFTKEEYYDEEVYQYVLSYLDGNKYKFIDQKTISLINDKIRSEFYKYQWISISKKGTIIYIDIAKANDDKVEDKDNLPGGLYSKYDAIIKGYVVKKGTSLIKKDMSINKGDELISGIIPMYNEKLEYVHPEGFVIGEVSEYKTIEIDAITEKTVKTGRFKKKRIYQFFNKSKNIEFDYFENYEVEYKRIFKIGKFIEVIDVYIYEIKEVVNNYSMEEAYQYAKSIIYDEFNSNRKYSNEKILDVKFVKGYISENTYYITYLVISLIDISYFKAYDNLDNLNNIS